MNIALIVMLVFEVLAASSLIASVLNKDKKFKEILEGLSPFFGFAGFISGVIGVGIIILGPQLDQDAAFTKAAESVFLGIRAVAMDSQIGSDSSLGSITLQDSSTMLVTPTASSSGKNSGSIGSGATAVSVALPNSHYTLTGSFSKDNKSWCFDLKAEGIDEAIYNENGPVASTVNANDIGSAVCSQGATFNAEGKLVK